MINFTSTPRKVIGAFTVYERVPRPKGMTKYFVGKEGADYGVDFGRFSVAVRHCKLNTPRPIPHIVLFDNKSAVSTVPINYTVLDGPHVHHASAAVDPATVAGILNLKPQQTEQQ